MEVRGAQELRQYQDGRGNSCCAATGLPVVLRGPHFAIRDLMSIARLGPPIGLTVALLVVLVKLRPRSNKGQACGLAS
jgi:hypothetical protein